MRSIFLAGCCCALLAVASQAQAQVLYDFNDTLNNASLGTNVKSITAAGKTLTITGLNANNTAHTLNYKTQGVDEHGVGLTGTLDNELTLAPDTGGTAIANWIQVDVSAVYQDPRFSSGQIRVQSVTTDSPGVDEGYDVWGTNTAGTMAGATKVISANGPAFDNLFATLPGWGTYKYYDLTVTPAGAGHDADNVLMDAIQVVPEPATMTLLGAGAVGLLGALRRRLNR